MSGEEMVVINTYHCETPSYCKEIPETRPRISMKDRYILTRAYRIVLACGMQDAVGYASAYIDAVSRNMTRKVVKQMVTN